MERDPDRTCIYRGREFEVSQGYSGKVRYTLDLPPELHMTSDDILHVLREIDKQEDAGGAYEYTVS